jgi:hypothetical protein
LANYYPQVFENQPQGVLLPLKSGEVICPMCAETCRALFPERSSNWIISIALSALQKDLLLASWMQERR